MELWRVRCKAFGARQIGIEEVDGMGRVLFVKVPTTLKHFDEEAQACRVMESIERVKQELH